MYEYTRRLNIMMTSSAAHAVTLKIAMLCHDYRHLQVVKCVPGIYRTPACRARRPQAHIYGLLAAAKCGRVIILKVCINICVHAQASHCALHLCLIDTPMPEACLYIGATCHTDEHDMR